MNSYNVSETLTIGEAVLRLQQAYPEVTHSSLRFLQREGLLEPTRSNGGHRLYTLRDLDRVRTIKQWQAQRLSLTEIRARLAAMDAMAPPSLLAQRFLKLASNGDIDAACREILLADDLGMHASMIFDEVLRPVLQEVGDHWANGTLNVGQEHEISEAIRDLIAEVTLRHAHPYQGMSAVLAACPSGERHDLGLRMICSLLRQRGARVHYLGVDVSPAFLVEMINLRRPDLVLLSVTLESNVRCVVEAATAVEEAFDGRKRAPRLVAGGQGCALRRTELRATKVTVLDSESTDTVAEAILSLVRPQWIDQSAP
jgi:methanogenic corrinoid protein MtbC1